MQHKYNKLSKNFAADCHFFLIWHITTNLQTQKQLCPFFTCPLFTSKTLYHPHPPPHLKNNIMSLSFFILSFCRLRWTSPVKSKDAYFENAAQTNFIEHSTSLLSVMLICKQTIRGSYPEYGGGGASCWPLCVRASLYEGRPGGTILDKGTDSGIGCPSTPIRTGTLWRCRIHQSDIAT